MSAIDKLIENSAQQLMDAEKYIKCALMLRQTDKTLADMYYTISKEEMNHAAMEQVQIERLLASPNLQHEWMKMVWNYEKNRMTERKANVNAMLTMYKS